MTIISNFLWPSDLSRAENNELERVCEYAEALYDESQEIERIRLNDLAKITELQLEVAAQKEIILKLTEEENRHVSNAVLSLA